MENSKSVSFPVGEYTLTKEETFVLSEWALWKQIKKSSLRADLNASS